MNSIEKFLDSLYLGDRFCENVVIEDGKIAFQINCISRVKEGTKEWNYYTEFIQCRIRGYIEKVIKKG